MIFPVRHISLFATGTAVREINVTEEEKNIVPRRLFSGDERRVLFHSNNTLRENLYGAYCRNIDASLFLYN